VKTEPLRLSISRLAYRKLMWYPKLVESEIGGLCKVTQNGDGLYIAETVLLKQRASGASVHLDMEALADFVGRVDDPSLYRGWWH